MTARTTCPRSAAGWCGPGWRRWSPGWTSGSQWRPSVSSSWPAGSAGSSRVWYWHQAGRDADAVLAGIHAAIPDPDGTIVVGPRPILRDNIANFLEDSLLTKALQLTYDDLEVRGHMSQSEDEFAEADPDLRFDIRPVSELQPE